jgi:site-specific DNA recombinase
MPLFGYRPEGKKREARLLIDERPIPGLEMSPADVVRLIFRLAAGERWSGQRIAEHLNALGVPTPNALNRPKAKTARQWWQTTVRCILINPRYKGVHPFGGGNGKKTRDVIEQPVPAIVDEETWERAQAAIAANTRFSPRNAKREYLLRGLMRCAHCGYRYSGTVRGKNDTPYYLCIGRNQASRLQVQCDGCAWVRATIEDDIWADIEGFLRNPEAVLGKLAGRMEATEGEGEAQGRRLEQLARALDTKAKDRNQVVSMCRRGLIDESEMVALRAEIVAEEASLKAEIARVQERAEGTAQAREALTSAETLLRELRGRVGEPWSFEEKRRVIETLVERITVETVQRGKKREPVVRIVYRFSEPGAIGNKACRRPGCGPPTCSPSPPDGWGRRRSRARGPPRARPPAAAP